jgi:hypothetical protein
MLSVDALILDITQDFRHVSHPWLSWSTHAASHEAKVVMRIGLCNLFALYRLKHDHRRCVGRRVLEEAGLQFKPAPIFNGRV